MALTAAGLYYPCSHDASRGSQVRHRRRHRFRGRPGRHRGAAQRVPRRATGLQGRRGHPRDRRDLPGLPFLDVQGAREPVRQARGGALHRAQRGGPAHRRGRHRLRHLRARSARQDRVQRRLGARHRPRHDLPVLRLPQVGVPRAAAGAAPARLSNAPAFPDYPPWELDPAFLPPERPASLVAAPVAAAAPAWNQPRARVESAAPAPAWNQPARAAAWNAEPVSAWREAPSAWDAAPARAWETGRAPAAADRQCDHPERARGLRPHRTQLPGAGQDGRRQGSTGPMAAGPVAPPTAPRPSAGRHRKP